MICLLPAGHGRKAHKFIAITLILVGSFCPLPCGCVQHAFYNGIGAFAVHVYLFSFWAISSAIAILSSLFPLFFFLFHSQAINGIHFRKIIDKVERVLYLVGDAGCQLTQRGHFFGLDELGLG
jgi:hypothetical protein